MKTQERSHLSVKRRANGSIIDIKTFEMKVNGSRRMLACIKLELDLRVVKVWVDKVCQTVPIDL